MMMMMMMMIIIIIIIRYGCLLSQAFSSRYFSWTSSDPHRSRFKLHTAALSVLCVMFQVQLSFVVNLSNVFPVQFPDVSLSFPLPFQWLQLLPVQPYISGSTFAVFLYANCCILTSFPLPFAQHFCLQVVVVVVIIHEKCVSVLEPSTTTGKAGYSNVPRSAEYPTFDVSCFPAYAEPPEVPA